MRVVIGITGASGAIYAKRLIEFLHKKHTLFVTISKHAKSIFEYETGVNFFDFIKTKDVEYFDNGDLYSPVASGSFKIDACCIVPCSMKTLSSIANGFSDSLISRCADVAIKEKRKLVVVPRETPFSSIHLENMLKLSNLGVYITVASTAFYNKPQTLEDVVDFVVGRILDNLGIDNSLYKRWEGKNSTNVEL